MNLTLQKPAAVVFDLDGTLVDSDAMILKSFQYALEPYGVAFSQADIEVIRTRRLEDLLKGYAPDSALQEATQRLIQHTKEAMPQVSLFTGVSEMLQALVAAGIPLAIWTGRDKVSAEDILKACSLRDAFHHVISNSCTPHSKPHPSGLLHLGQQWKLPPSQMLMVGDHEHDILTAQAAGSHPCLAFWNERADRHLATRYQVKVFDKPSALADAILGAAQSI